MAGSLGLKILARLLAIEQHIIEGRQLVIFIKTFKGYEDKTLVLDADVNSWVAQNEIDVVDVKSVLSHEHESRAGSGDLLYTVMYRADAPVD